MIKGTNILLKAFDAEDSERFREWMNDGENLEAFGNPYIVNELEGQQWYEKLAWDRTKLYLSIYDVQTSAHTGNLWFKHIDHKNAKAELCFITDKNAKQKNNAEAVKLAVEFAFGYMNLHKIYANIAMSNIETRNLLEKCGFRSEGILQEEIFTGGEYDDVSRLAIFRHGTAAKSREPRESAAEHAVPKPTGPPQYQWFQSKKS